MVTAKEVNRLRQQTGAGMMDCKKALTEAKGDFDKAIENLRKRGQEVYLARAERSTTEGAVWAKTNKHASYGAMVTLNCETDFVAKNAHFQQLGQQILEAALIHQPPTTEELLLLKVEKTTIQEKIAELITIIGEKVTVSHYTTLSGDTVATYIHLGNKIGVLVALKSDSHGPHIVEAAKNVAMQVAALNPIAVDKDHIDTSTVHKELEIAREQARNEGKPENMLDKIAQGKISKFFKEKTLLNQPFIKDNSITVAKYLANTAPNLTVAAFKQVAIS